MKRRFFLKIISLLTCLFYLGSQPGAYAQEIKFPAPAPFLIPAEWGRVEEWRGRVPKVVLIQDAHGEYEAQKNTAAILNFLSQKKPIQNLLLEGGAGKLDPKRLEFFKEPRFNQQAVDFLAREAEAGGAEIFLISDFGSRKRPSVFGLEDPALYVQNLEAFQKVMRLRPQSEEFLESELSLIRGEAGRVLRPDSKAFFKEWMRYESSQELLRFLNSLQSAAGKNLDINLNDPRSQLAWPQLVRFFELKKREPRLRPDLARKEREALVEWAETAGISPRFVKILRRPETAFPDRRRFWEAFYEAAHPKGFDFESFPQLALYEGAQILQREIESPKLFEEIRSLTDQVLQEMTETPGEKDLLRRIRHYFLMKKLLHLQLSRLEFKELEAEIPALPQKDIFQTARLFYSLALRREEAMGRLLKASSKNVTVAVTGGFHTEFLVSLLRKQGIPYAVISPHLSRLNSNGKYTAAMTGEKTALDFQSSALMQAAWMWPQAEQFPSLAARRKWIRAQIEEWGRSRGATRSDSLESARSEARMGTFTLNTPELYLKRLEQHNSAETIQEQRVELFQVFTDLQMKHLSRINHENEVTAKKKMSPQERADFDRHLAALNASSSFLKKARDAFIRKNFIKAFQNWAIFQDGILGLAPQEIDISLPQLLRWNALLKHFAMGAPLLEEARKKAVDSAYQDFTNALIDFLVILKNKSKNAQQEKERREKLLSGLSALTRELLGHYETRLKERAELNEIYLSPEESKPLDVLFMRNKTSFEKYILDRYGLYEDDLLFDFFTRVRKFLEKASGRQARSEVRSEEYRGHFSLAQGNLVISFNLTKNGDAKIQMYIETRPLGGFEASFKDGQKIRFGKDETNTIVFQEESVGTWAYHLISREALTLKYEHGAWFFQNRKGSKPVRYRSIEYGFASGWQPIFSVESLKNVFEDFEKEFDGIIHRYREKKVLDEEGKVSAGADLSQIEDALAAVKGLIRKIYLDDVRYLRPEEQVSANLFLKKLGALQRNLEKAAAPKRSEMRTKEDAAAFRVESILQSYSKDFALWAEDPEGTGRPNTAVSRYDFREGEARPQKVKPPQSPLDQKNFRRYQQSQLRIKKFQTAVQRIRDRAEEISASAAKMKEKAFQTNEMQLWQQAEELQEKSREMKKRAEAFGFSTTVIVVHAPTYLLANENRYGVYHVGRRGVVYFTARYIDSLRLNRFRDMDKLAFFLDRAQRRIEPIERGLREVEAKALAPENVMKYVPENFEAGDRIFLRNGDFKGILQHLDALAQKDSAEKTKREKESERLFQGIRQIEEAFNRFTVTRGKRPSYTSLKETAHLLDKLLHHYSAEGIHDAESSYDFFAESEILETMQRRLDENRTLPTRDELDLLARLYGILAHLQENIGRHQEALRFYKDQIDVWKESQRGPDLAPYPLQIQEQIIRALLKLGLYDDFGRELKVYLTGNDFPRKLYREERKMLGDWLERSYFEAELIAISGNREGLIRMIKEGFAEAREKISSEKWAEETTTNFNDEPAKHTVSENKERILLSIEVSSAHMTGKGAFHIAGYSSRTLMPRRVYQVLGERIRKYFRLGLFLKEKPGALKIEISPGKIRFYESDIFWFESAVLQNGKLASYGQLHGDPMKMKTGYTPHQKAADRKFLQSLLFFIRQKQLIPEADLKKFIPPLSPFRSEVRQALRMPAVADSLESARSEVRSQDDSLNALKFIQMKKILSDKKMLAVSRKLGRSSRKGMTPSTDIPLMGRALRRLSFLLKGPQPIEMNFETDFAGANVLLIGPSRSGEDLQELITRYPKIANVHVVDIDTRVFSGNDRTLLGMSKGGADLPPVYGYKINALSLPEELTEKIDFVIHLGVVDDSYFSPQQKAQLAKEIVRVLKAGGAALSMPLGDEDIHSGDPQMMLHPALIDQNRGLFFTIKRRSEVRNEHSVLEVTIKVTNKILGLDLKEKEELYALLFPAVSSFEESINKEERAKLVSAYGELLPSGGAAVIPAQLLLGLSKKSREEYLSAVYEGSRKGDHAKAQIVFAGTGAVELKEKLSSALKTLHQFFKFSSLDEWTAAKAQKTESVSISFTEIQNHAADSRIPALLLPAERIEELSESDRFRYLNQLTQLQLLAAQAPELRGLKGEPLEIALIRFLRKLQIDFNAQNGFITPSTQSLLAADLTQALAAAKLTAQAA